MAARQAVQAILMGPPQRFGLQLAAAAVGPPVARRLPARSWTRGADALSSPHARTHPSRRRPPARMAPAPPTVAARPRARRGNLHAPPELPGDRPCAAE